jgi:hypothetical protein
MDKYTRAELEKFRKYGDVTKNGVVFDWWLASCEGAGFRLIREPHHTDEDIELAKHYLKSDRDVVGKIGVSEVE